MFSIFMLLTLIEYNYASEPYHTPRRIEATFSFEMIIDQKDFDLNNDLQYWLPLPTNSKNQQRVEIISISPRPLNIKKDSKKNIQIAYWDFSKINESKTYSVNIDLQADLYRVDYFLDPEIVPDEYDWHQNIFNQYTKSDSLAFITPEIAELANELTQRVADPFLKARNIYRWVLQHLEHQFPVKQRGTRFLFSNPIDSKQSIYGGDSAEYSWVFIALCRAAGVPARAVVGFLAKPDWETPHTWAEFYLPKWGWLPADPYVADSKELLVEISDQYDEYYYLGHLDNYHLAFYQGSGIALEPNCPYSHKPFIFDNSTWYAPIGVWNFEKFSNASANLMVTFDALIVNKYENLEYGIKLELPDPWFQQSETELGPYILKERFLTQDKSVKMDFVGRRLPASIKNINSKKAAQLEIKSLKKLNRSYQIISEKPIRISHKDAFQFIARFDIENKSVQEYRVYIVERDYLFWLIGSAEKEIFEQNFKTFQTITKNLTLNIPERRLR